MQDGPKDPPAASYSTFRPSITRNGRLITIVDKNNVLCFIDADDGEILLRLKVPGGEVVAEPWIVGDMLIVAATKGISAYSLNSLSPK